MEHRTVQKMAKDAMEYAVQSIRPGMRLAEVRKLAEDKLMDLGADSFWYWDIGAFVFAGDETILSVSGREYQTAERLIGETDIITIDLSPQANGVWGDYARTIILEEGRVVSDVRDIRNSEWREGLLMEERLHEEMQRFVTEETTFEMLYDHINRMIDACGYVNLDFAGNLGHSIAARKQERIYIERGNRARLSEVSCFTFEPHIAKTGSTYGFKREDIYQIRNGKAAAL